MKISTIEQLNDIKTKNFEKVHMREVGQKSSAELIDVLVLGGDTCSYEEVSNFIKKIYDFYNKKDIKNVRVVYRNLGFGDTDFDIKINHEGKKFFVNDITIDEVNEKLEKIFKEIDQQ